MSRSKKRDWAWQREESQSAPRYLIAREISWEEVTIDEYRIMILRCTVRLTPFDEQGGNGITRIR